MPETDNGGANTSHHQLTTRAGEKFQTSDIIECLNLNHARGEILVSLIRAGRKPGESEMRAMKKIEYYVQREIARLKIIEEDENQEQLPLSEHEGNPFADENEAFPHLKS